MASNTKLADHEKIDRKQLLSILGTGGRPDCISENGVTTIVFKHRGHTVEFSMAVASPEETKFRRKVGQYLALQRFENCGTVIMATPDFLDMYNMLGMGLTFGENSPTAKTLEIP
jgi:hypothetical protein